MKNLGSKEMDIDEIGLRKFETEDLQDMFDNYCNDEEVCRYLTWTPHREIGVTRGLLTGWINQYDDTIYRWAITIDNRVIGSVSLVSVDLREKRGVLGYCLGRKYWGRGIMTRVLGSVIDYCFNEVGFKRLEAVHHMDNKVSGGVMLKNKMKFDRIIGGVHRDNTGKIIEAASYYIENESNNLNSCKV